MDDTARFEVAERHVELNEKLALETVVLVLSRESRKRSGDATRRDMIMRWIAVASEEVYIARGSDTSLSAEEERQVVQ